MDSLTCSICIHEFDQKNRVPLVLYCGHTFCKKCIEDTERRMRALQCPLCRSLDFREVSSIKKNLLVFQHLNPSNKSPLVPCSRHTGQESIFFCITDNIPFCSKCATLHKSHDFYDIDDPLITQGTDTELNQRFQRAEDLLKSANRERENIIEIYERLEEKKKKSVDLIHNAFEVIINETKRKQEEFIKSLNGKYNSTSRKIQKVIEDCDVIIEKKKVSIEKLLNARKEISRLANTARFQAFEEMKKIDLIEESVSSNLEFLSAEVDNVRFDVEVNTSFVLEKLREMTPGETIKEEALVWKPVPIDIDIFKSNPLQVRLVKQLLESGIDFSDKVRKILERVDRKYFMPSECHPYSDSPQQISHNTTISAPHMHAYTLSWLEKYLFAGANVLDVGCGSGYLTVCLALMIGRGKVTGLDHIEDIINEAMENIMKGMPDLLTSPEINFALIHGDGRLGLPQHAPFNVIHIGASTLEIPRPLIEQLAPGGIIIAPIGPRETYQKITILEKDLDGGLHYNTLINVNYAPLVDREQQCPTIFNR